MDVAIRRGADLPDPWRASWIALSMAAAGGVAVAWLLALIEGILTGVVVGSLLAGMMALAEMQAAWRLRRALARFAAALPAGERVAWQRWTSEQGVRWPALGVSARGVVASYRVGPLVVEAQGSSFLVRPREAATAAREIARRLGLAGEPR